MSSNVNLESAPSYAQYQAAQAAIETIRTDPNKGPDSAEMAAAGQDLIAKLNTCLRELGHSGI